MKKQAEAWLIGAKDDLLTIYEIIEWGYALDSGTPHM